jgi:hypothetical protein
MFPPLRGFGFLEAREVYAAPAFQPVNLLTKIGRYTMV